MNITVDVASTMSAAAAPEADDEPSSSSSDDPRAKALLMNTSSFANRLANGERPKERDQKLIKQVEAMTSAPPTPAGNGDMVIGGDNRHVHFKDAPSTVSIRGDGETTEGADEAQDKPTNTSASVDVSARGDNGGKDDAAEDNPTGTSTSMDTGGDDSGSKSTSGEGGARDAPFHSSWNNKSDTNNNKNAPDSWGEYIAYFFNKAEVCQYYILFATLFLQCCLQCYLRCQIICINLIFDPLFA